MTDIPTLFRDDRFVVLDKPAGLPCHPGRAGGPSVEDLFPLLSRRRIGPWLAHRLDTDTAGCLVIALRRAALLEAQTLFAAGRADKLYWAVVRGRPAESSGILRQPLRRTEDEGWRMVPGGDTPAITEWTVLGTTDTTAWLALRPRTGRTHQVRAHCAALGCPVLGDPIYGGGDGPMHLIARAIRLPLAPPVSATAPPPAALRPALAGCGWSDDQRRQTSVEDTA